MDKRKIKLNLYVDKLDINYLEISRLLINLPGVVRISFVPLLLFRISYKFQKINVDNLRSFYGSIWLLKN